MKKCSCGACGVDIEHGVAAVSAHEHNHDHEESGSCSDGACHCHDGDGDITTMRQDIISVVAAVVLFVAGFFVPSATARLILNLAAALVAGAPIFWEGIKNILKLDLEEMALMTVAVIAAICIGEVGEAVIVAVLFRIGEIFEDLAVARSRRSVEAVTEIIPDTANLVDADGRITTVSARTLPIGSIILVKSGERFPVDSRVVSGSSSVDLSSLTGESLPRSVSPGDQVLSSAINLGGVLTCETVSDFEDSAAAKIIEMVRDASAKKGSTERFITRFARVYTPIVMFVAIMVAVLPPLLGFGAFTTWIYRALVFLVASCPCALVIATPLSFFGGIGAASKQGILIKGSRYVEALAKARGVVFDKTGTLTTGKPVVSRIVAVNGVSQAEVLRLAAICESRSNHPIAQAVVQAAGEVDTAELVDCEEITAQGMVATIGADQVLCGSARLMEANNIDTAGLPEANLYVARGGEMLGSIEVADQARPEAREAIGALGKLGVHLTSMLTGDGAEAAALVQRQTGVGSVHANLLPQDKVSLFEKIKAGVTGTTLYVGDGINDSPVLARSDAGIAMGLASDAAMQAADVVLLSDNLSSLPQAIRIARNTSRLAKGIITFALAVKLAVLVFAFFGIANMWMAVFADVGVTLIAVLLATLALRFQ